MLGEDRERLQAHIAEKEEKLRSYKAYVAMSYEDFKELISAYAYDIMLQRSVKTAYVIDVNNGPIIKQLYLYFTNNPECRWNLNAGIMFAGSVGCGKSLLMMAYLRISNEYSRKITTTVHAKALGDQIRKNGMETYYKRPMFIDELGREETEIKDYGTVIKPVIDLIAHRYEAGARTYATTNFNFKSLENFYGEFIRNRMEEMMTFVKFPGESRRLKNEVKNR